MFLRHLALPLFAAWLLAWFSPAHADTPLRWNPFTDPGGAFTVEAPAGWSVVGGVTRRSATDVSWYATAVSPDAEITVRVGDPQIGLIPVAPTVPGKDALARTPDIARPYETGTEFALHYARTMVTQLRLCDKPKREGTFVEPNPPGFSAALGRQVTTGDAFLLCIDRNYLGYAVATTILAASPAEIWNAAVLGAFAAPVGRRAEAAHVLRHMMDSWAFAPAWVAKAAGGPLAGQLAALHAPSAAGERAQWEAQLDTQAAPALEHIDGIMTNANATCESDPKMPARHACGESGHPLGK